MCYIPNIRERSCRFGGNLLNRKWEEYCPFCKRTRNKTSLYRRPTVPWTFRPAEPCPALNTPGHTIVEPGMEVLSTQLYHPDMIIHLGPGHRIAAVTVFNQDQTDPAPQAP